MMGGRREGINLVVRVITGSKKAVKDFEYKYATNFMQFRNGTPSSFFFVFD